MQHYSWGKPASEANVARLAELTHDLRPCAEFWMGAHPKAPAMVQIGGTSIRLNELIAEYPEEILGQRVFERFGPALPFLFKALSIRTALSIQAHPDKVLADKLHQVDPANYPDRNPKPEMAIALGPVSLLYGFRRWDEIGGYLRRTPELAELVDVADMTAISQASLDAPDEATMTLYRALFRVSRSRLSAASKKLFDRLHQEAKLTAPEKWILRLANAYPEGDVGLFSFYLMNFVELAPGEAIFVEPNIPHAYLEGEMIECMANSDNVVRAGLTEKHKDIETLLGMLRYDGRPPVYIQPETQTQSQQVYSPPVAEFLLERITAGAEVELTESHGVCVLLCNAGSTTLEGSSGRYELPSGSVTLIPAKALPLQLRCDSGELFMARVP